MRTPRVFICASTPRITVSTAKRIDERRGYAGHRKYERQPLQDARKQREIRSKRRFDVRVNAARDRHPAAGDSERYRKQRHDGGTDQESQGCGCAQSLSDQRRKHEDACANRRVDDGRRQLANTYGTDESRFARIGERIGGMG
jgi:hypothetical protein